MALLTGTALAVTNGNTSVSDTNATFIQSGVRAGDIIMITDDDGANHFNMVASDPSTETALTLAAAYPGATDTGLSWTVDRFYGKDVATDSYRLLNEYIASLETAIVPLSQAEYDEIETPNSTTLYAIIG